MTELAEVEVEEVAPPEHQIRMLAVVSLVYTPAGWVVEEDPAARLDPDDDLVCVNEGHMLALDGGATRAGCELLKDHARNLPLPSAQQVAEAFLRVSGTAPIAVHRRTATMYGWVYDPVLKADLCPSCQKLSVPAS